jgi:uncharacterized ferritin-like protein (DUF455 family)
MITLHEKALECLMACGPEEKSRLTHALYLSSRDHELELDLSDSPVAVEICVPGRPEKPRLVAPRDLERRRLGTREGQASLLHSLTHIEFNAINLALDAVYRYRGQPEDFYRDWIRVADEEATHFLLLRNHLRVLGYDYGDFPAHDGLWEMAHKTAHDVLARMALVPRCLEARGLDVTPGIRDKLINCGDPAAAAILDIILRDEIGHVRIGDRWFRYCCLQRGLEPESSFRALVEEYFIGRLKGPFNLDARRQVGFSEAELHYLEQAR